MSFALVIPGERKLRQDWLTEYWTIGYSDQTYKSRGE